MHSHPTHSCSFWSRAAAAWQALARLGLLGLIAGLTLLAPAPSRADAPELIAFEITHDADGVRLSFATYFDLPKAVAEALRKGVPLHFVATAEVYRDRWYWSDKRVARVSRSWRLAWQPLTRKYRVSFSGLSQNFDTLSEALGTLRSGVNWKVADAGQIEENARHYLEFSYRLDTDMLPRPMQIGVDGQADWQLLIERVQRFE